MDDRKPRDWFCPWDCKHHQHIPFFFLCKVIIWSTAELWCMRARHQNITTKWDYNERGILFCRVNLNPLSLLLTGIQSLSEHQIAPLPLGTPLRGLQHISLYWLLTQHTVSVFTSFFFNFILFFPYISLLWCTKHLSIRWGLTRTRWIYQKCYWSMWRIFDIS